MTITRLAQNKQSLFLGSVSAPYLSPVICQFDPVPPGYVWTGTFSAVAQKIVTSSALANPTTPGIFDFGNDLLSEVIWTLYRNGSAEQTWQGTNMLCNIQGFGNDQFTVVGFFPSTPATGVEPLAFPINVTVNYTGYSGTESEVPLVVPFVSMTQQNRFTNPLNPNVPNYPLMVQTSKVGVNTDQTMLTGPIPGTGFTGNALLVSAFISLTNLAGTSGTSVIATLQDNGGAAYDSVCCLAGASMATSQSMAVDLHLVRLTLFPMTLHFQTSGTGLNFTCSAGVLWQPEVEVAPFIP